MSDHDDRLLVNKDLVLPAAMQADISACNRVMQLTVSDAESYEVALELGRDIKKMKKARVDFFADIKRAIDESKRKVLDKERAAIQPLDRALAHLDTQATTWRREQDRIANEKRRAAEKEQQDRVAEQRRQEAENARAVGREALAKKIEDAPLPTLAVAATPLPSVSGTRKRVNWKFKVVDVKQVPREWCMPNEKEIGEFVREQKENSIGKIPGIEVYSEEHTI